MSITSYIPKAIGGASALLFGYGAYKRGRINAGNQTSQDTASMLTNTIVSDQFVSNPNPITESLKETRRNFLMDNSFVQTLYSVKNNVVEIGKQGLKSIIPLGLAAGAVLPKMVKTNVDSNIVKKAPFLSKACAGLLALWGVKTIATDVIGIGRKDDIYSIK